MTDVRVNKMLKYLMTCPKISFLVEGLTKICLKKPFNNFTEIVLTFLLRQIVDYFKTSPFMYLYDI